MTSRRFRIRGAAAETAPASKAGLARGEPDGIADHQRRCVDDDLAGFRLDNRKARQNGVGEGCVDSFFEARSTLAGAETEIFLDHQYLGPDALKLDHALFTAARPLESHVSRSTALGNSGKVEKILIELGYLKK